MKTVRLIKEELENFQISEKEAISIKILWKMFKRWVEETNIHTRESAFSDLYFRLHAQERIPGDYETMIPIFFRISKKLKNYPNRPLYLHKVYTNRIYFLKKRQMWQRDEDIYWVYTLTPDLPESEFRKLHLNRRLSNKGYEWGKYNWDKLQTAEPTNTYKVTTFKLQ